MCFLSTLLLLTNVFSYYLLLCSLTNVFSYFLLRCSLTNVFSLLGYNGPGRKAMLRLKCEVLDRILLRRTKEGKSDDLVIPPKYIVLRKDPFDPFEADYYQAAYTQSQTQFNAYVSSGNTLGR